MDIVLFDHVEWKQLFPLTLSKPIAELRIGINTIADKWQDYLAQPINYHCAPYLRDKYPYSTAQSVLLINGAVLPSAELIKKIKELSLGQVLLHQSAVVAANIDNYNPNHPVETLIDGLAVQRIDRIDILQWPEDILKLNDRWIDVDMDQYKDTTDLSQLLNSRIIGPRDRIIIGANTEIYALSLNTMDGPIYIGNNVLIMEGAMLRGPLVIGDGTVVKMGAKIYGKTSIGPNCKVGGEIKRVVMHANSNKGHDGYLGDSVIGEWCNFGADSNNSNMKNTYGKVNLYDMSADAKRKTSEQFLGLIMGDHCRCGINTQFNTGTVAAYFAHIFGEPPSTYIRPFQWGHDGVFDIEKSLEIAQIVYTRRHIEFTPGDETIIKYLYHQYCS